MPNAYLDVHQLPDGTRLMAPHRQTTSTLRLDQWVSVNGSGPWRIADMRQSPGAGRIVYLSGHPFQRADPPPLLLTPGDVLPVYTVIPPTIRAAAARR